MRLLFLSVLEDYHLIFVSGLWGIRSRLGWAAQVELVKPNIHDPAQGHLYCAKLRGGAMLGFVPQPNLRQMQPNHDFYPLIITQTPPNPAQYSNLPIANISMTNTDFYHQLRALITTWATELGFAAVGVADTDLSEYEPGLDDWLNKGYQGSMGWMAEHGHKRSRPAELLPGTVRVISARMDYLPANSRHIQVLKNPEQAYIARYALGGDYHKLLRKRMARLGDNIREYVLAHHPDQDIVQRAFVDSAPVMERPLAEKAGLGWTGKNTLILHEKAGSFFLLAELFTNLPIPLDQQPQTNRCGDCIACLKICPTDAFPQPYVLDARRCISYLTIENEGPIPLEFREPMGNRVFGCDDCQAICPWNKFARPTDEDHFKPRHNLDAPDLLTLFNWTEEEFLEKTLGSPIRRVGYHGWLRNLAIGLGNAPSSAAIIASLTAKKPKVPAWIGEHFDWAIAQQENPTRRRKRKVKRENSKSISD